jgi:uncharacterized protein with NRDE domain
MCVIFLAFDRHPEYPLILLANRDEFYDRPANPAAYWQDFPNIFAGRDLVGGGTWLGVTKQGRFAAVTNYRDPKAPAGTVSRGNLVADFLKTNEPGAEYLKNIQAVAARFSGFNLFAGEINAGKKELFYYSNRGEEIKKLNPGIYGLSNHLLDTPWPKVEKGKARFAGLLKDAEISREGLFELLSDETLAADGDLPHTGIPYAAEKALSAIFIKTPGYGTRCATVLTIDRNFAFELEERVFV